MEFFKKKIETIMTADEVDAQPVATALLHAGSLLYGTGVKLKNVAYDKGFLTGRELPCRVVSVGNIVAGGTGKTPMTIYLASLLKNTGHHPVVISRGYGGKAESKGIVVSDGYEILCTPDISGDEPFMMASKIRGVPVIVGGDRYRSGQWAISEFNPDVILLDDGFQHRKLHRNLDLLLVDAAKMFGNGYLLPRGTLREHVSALGRSDAIVFTRCAEGSEPSMGCLSDFGFGHTALKLSSYKKKPVFRTNHITYVSGIYHGDESISLDIPVGKKKKESDSLKDSRVFVFSGIARNEEFLKSVENRVKTVVGKSDFLDHHQYTDAELNKIASDAANAGADFLVTTEKDFVRIAGKVPGNIPVIVMGVEIVFKDDDESAFVRFVRDKILTR